MLVSIVNREWFKMLGYWCFWNVFWGLVEFRVSLVQNLAYVLLVWFCDSAFMPIYS